ncbi:MAG: HlyD family efflux transporter periplasmic adaptor subunit [Planctomycetes bacterium]|nr:HlyD family efflux transporter periplasmic adaptor subunit [Planctomycetota bacterium]
MVRRVLVSSCVAALLACIGVAAPAQEDGTVRGRLVPATEAVACASTDGRVERVLVNPGDAVEEGQVLAVLANSDVDNLAEISRVEVRGTELTLEAARLRRSMAEAELAAGQKQLDEMRAQMEQGKSLLEAHSISEEQYAQGRMAIEQMEAKLADGKSVVRLREIEAQQAEAALERSRLDLDRAGELRAGLEVRSPIAGRVAEVLAVPGQWIAKGAVLARIFGMAPPVFEGELPESLFARVAPGTRFSVEGPACQATLEATVDRVAPVAERRGAGEATVRVRAIFGGDAAALDVLLPGLTARAAIVE